MRLLSRLWTGPRPRLLLSLALLLTVGGCVSPFGSDNNRPSDARIPAGAIFLATTGNDANNGSQSAPVRTLNRAMSLVPASGTLVVRGGTYRDWYNSGGTYKISTKGLTIENYPGEEVWFDGTDIVPASRWVNAGGGKWYTAWSTPSFCNGQYYAYPPTNQPTANNGPCAHADMDSSSAAPMAGDPQMAFVNDSELAQKPSLASTDANSFYYDWANRRLYIATDPNGKAIALTARPLALVLGGDNPNGNRLIGIGFRRYATNEYTNITGSAVYFGGTGPNRVEDSAFDDNAAGALSFSNPRPGSYLKASVLVNNGSTAFGANGGATLAGGNTNNFLVQGNLFSGNNTEEFGTGCTKSCGAANVKFAHMNGLTFRNNVVEYARGPANGVWHDLLGRNVSFVGNLVRYNGVGSNKGKGIFYEVSNSGRIVSNLVYGNGGPGITVSAGNTKIWNNTVVDNQIGIWVYDDPRYPGQNPDVEVNTSNVEVVNNVVSEDQTFLAKSSAAWANDAENNQPKQFYSRFDYNAYDRESNATQILHMWDQAGGGIAYRSVTSFTGAWGWDGHGIDVAAGGDPFFVNKAAGDYRIRSNSPAFDSGAPLPADIAGLVGLPTGAVESRGYIP